MEIEFSVIIPAYNRAETLGRAIESVLNQTFHKYELIVVDDGSTDDTKELVQKFPAVRYYFQENKGVCAARNLGAGHSNGKWLVFLDSDDELLDNALQEFKSEIDSQPEVKVFQGGYFIVKNGSLIQRHAIQGNSSFVSGSFTIARLLFKSLNGFDQELKFAENTELVFRLERKGISISKLESMVLKYYQNPEGGSKNLQNMIDSILIILEKHDSYLTNHVKHLYHQLVGVNLMRFQNYPLARTHLWKAWIFKPYKLATLGRLGISFLPPLARNLYKPEVRK